MINRAIETQFWKPGFKNGIWDTNIFNKKYNFDGFPYIIFFFSQIKIYANV